MASRLRTSLGLMQNSRTAPRVLALLAPLKEQVGLIALSDQFDFLLIPQSDVRTPNERVHLRVSPRKSTVDAGLRSNVASLTVLYGENGGGKTQLMLDACRSLSNLGGERRISILWESDGRFYLDPGSMLRRRITVDSPGTEIIIRDIEHSFGSVFYTTSPFESSKRRFVTSENFYDVTPSFSPANPFDGAALLKAFSKLPQEFSFIAGAKVRMKVRSPSLRSVLEKITPSLKRPDATPHYFGDSQRRIFERLSTLLEIKVEQALVIELTIALQGGVNRAAASLISLVDRVAILDNENGRSSIGDDIRGRTNRAVVQFLKDPLRSNETKFLNALVLHHFLHINLPPAIEGMGRRTTLGKLAESFQEFNEGQWAMVREATELGLLTWSFRDLSSGQVALLMLFTSIASSLNKLRGGETAFLFIDEGEMFMHPAWQRKYITHLLDFLGRTPEIAQGLHVVLSTHSLIVAADAPPNRLFDVKTGEMTNGFGYGPKDLLDNIYGVEEFPGQLAGELMESLIDFIRGRDVNQLNPQKALRLAESIADERLRTYLTNELTRRRLEGRS